MIIDVTPIQFIRESTDGLVHRSCDDPAVIQPSQTRYIPCMGTWVHSFRESTSPPTCLQCIVRL